MKLISVGTCAYNEEENIEKFITAIQSQHLSKANQIKEIIVITSGCTDSTVDIVKRLRKQDKRIKLINQIKREGKAVAVNLFLKNASCNILILQSADTLPDKYCYKYLLSDLSKKEVGLVAGKIVPTNDIRKFLGFANHLKWELHHKLNLKYPNRPKVGELIAFKKVFERIPPETAVDEASIEPLIHLQGFKIKYNPKAIIYNQGPKNLREYLSGRRRIYAGHYKTKQKYAYEIVTLKASRIFPVFLQTIKIYNINHMFYAFFTLSLEAFARIVGFMDVKFKLRDHTVWKIAKTTKGFD